MIFFNRIFKEKELFIRIQEVITSFVNLSAISIKPCTVK